MPKKILLLILLCASLVMPGAPVSSTFQTPLAQQQQSQTVYITRTGHKYHRVGCRYLSHSSIPISLREAEANGYAPCSICNPPQ